MFYETAQNVGRMLGSAPVVPFFVPPRKSWEDGQEKKKRLRIDLNRDEDDDIEEELFVKQIQEVEEESEESEDDFDMQEYIADLLPGDIVDGMKPIKQANMSHLMDLRLKPKPHDSLKYLKWFWRFLMRQRAQERERRKHYLLKEWELRIADYDRTMRKKVLERMEAHRKAVEKELKEARKRRIKNSRKKIERNHAIEQFTSDLERRDKEQKKIEYFCKKLSAWQIEGWDRDEELEKQRLQAIEDKKHAAIAISRAAYRKKVIEDDAAILEDDKALTKKVETVMIRYGMIEYEKETNLSTHEQVQDIFARNRVRQVEEGERREKLREEEAWAMRGEGQIVAADNVSKMTINLKNDLDLVKIRKKLAKNLYKRTSAVPTPFEQDLSGTGQILTLKCERIYEAGALALAAELMRGACPMLETLNLNKCEVRSEGIGRIFQGIKAANLLSIRTLLLKGNFIQATGLQYLQEVCPSGVFMNLSVLDLSENELGDDGLSVLVNIIIQGHFLNMVRLDLQHNSITDAGFQKIVAVMKSLQESKCPQLDRLRLENNLFSSQARRDHAPYPLYFSF